MQSVISRTLACALILAQAGSLAVGHTAAARQQLHHRVPHHRAPGHHPHHRVHRPRRHHQFARLPADYGAWSHVASCESGGWQVLGYAYPDSLGISRANWAAFGGTPLPPGSVSRAGRATEIRVADRLAAHYHAAIPDQYGCGAW